MGALSGLSGVSSLSGMLPRAVAAIVPPDNTITINWAGVGKPVNRKNYAVNTYRALSPVTTSNQAYQSLLNQINPEFIRIHSLDMMKDSTLFDLGWIVNPSSVNCDWNTTKIQSALTSLAGKAVTLTICRFPAGLCDSSGKLLSQHYLKFANLCVALIAVVQQTGVNLLSVGLLNEIDSIYGNDNSWHNVWIAARNAIKTAYPTLAIGGASFANAWNQQRIDAYIQTCGGFFDFFTANTYATGAIAGTDNQILYNRAVGSVKSLISFIRSRLTAAGRGTLPIQISEAGLSYALDPLNRTEIRGVWEGLRLIHTATEAGAGIMAWNESDDFHGLYSSPSSGYKRRMASHVYEAFNTWMTGTAYPTTITGSTVTVPVSPVVTSPSVSALAVANGTKRSIAIVNRSGLSKGLKINHAGWSSVASSGFESWSIRPDATATRQALSRADFDKGEFTIAPNEILLIKAV